MPGESNTRKTGSYYEAVAAKHLQRQGYELLERNYRCRTGEVDIIARDRADGSLCFVEVKYRGTLQYGYPGEAVGSAKQRKIRAVSGHYLLTHPEQAGENVNVRFDVTEIVGDRIRILKNAF